MLLSFLSVCAGAASLAPCCQPLRPGAPFSTNFFREARQSDVRIIGGLRSYSRSLVVGEQRLLQPRFPLWTAGFCA